MKIAIIGTRGIPNNHGGFEQFAEFLSEHLVSSNHEVFVYNSHCHPYKEKQWKGVNIVHKYDPEYKIGTAGQFIYDLNCILHTRKSRFDIILQLGYTSSSVWNWLFPKNSVIITNMDGLEWKRSKYSKKVQIFLKFAEKLAVKKSDFLISDSLGIQDYLKKKYNIDSKYIAYGAEIFDNPSEKVLKKYNAVKDNFNLLIARLEPENNVETILDGVQISKSKTPILVVGKFKTKFGEYLVNKYKNDSKIRFLGGVYNQNHLNNLRYYSKLYFHGHSVGGTNPSLLEAMASNTLIIAHDNIFNKSILEGDALYFSNKFDVQKHLGQRKKDNLSLIENNLNKIKQYFLWDIVNRQYENYILKCLQS